MTLDNDLARILGVAEPPKVAAESVPYVGHKGWAPERPEPVWEYRISVYRSEYGSAYIQATSAEAAMDEVGSGDIDWDDHGDIEWGSADVEQVDGDTPANQDELDDWDEKFGNKFDHDGEPKCSACDENFRFDDLTQDPGDLNAWYCPECVSDYLDPIHP